MKEKLLRELLEAMNAEAQDMLKDPEIRVDVSIMPDTGELRYCIIEPVGRNNYNATISIEDTFYGAINKFLEAKEEQKNIAVEKARRVLKEAGEL